MSPIYIYFCEKCKVETEELFSSLSRPETIHCKECYGEAKLTVGSGHFKVKGANAANSYSGDSNFRFIRLPKGPAK